MTLAQQTATNLTHQHLWSNVKIDRIDLPEGYLDICLGIPPEKLHPDDEEIATEYIVPVKTEDKWTIHQWSDIFEALQNHFRLATGPRRIIMAMVTNDSTVVFYFVNRGLIKPRKN